MSHKFPRYSHRSPKVYIGAHPDHGPGIYCPNCWRAESEEAEHAAGHFPGELVAKLRCDACGETVFIDTEVLSKWADIKRERASESESGSASK